MSITLKKLCTENNNPFELTLVAGYNSFRNSVSWAYVFEDESMIRYLHSSELVVTTALQQVTNPNFLISLTKKLVAHKAAGLIINTGGFIKEIPPEVIDYCDAHEFPLLFMPWHIHITDMIQNFCTRIVNEQHAFQLHDEALKNMVLGKGNDENNREILSQYYDMNGDFVVFLIYTTFSETSDHIKDEDIETRFINEIRRFKTSHSIKRMKTGLIRYDNYELLVLNNCDPALLPKITEIIFRIFKEFQESNSLFIGMGNPVYNISDLPISFQRARTALRMAQYRKEPLIRFEDMGFYKILFSVSNETVLFSYADEILSPLDAMDTADHHYLQLLAAYIQNDRSLEKTAAALFMHRNTVNYQVQKLKQVLGSPLKTVQDLFPFQVALAIRSMDAD